MMPECRRGVASLEIWPENIAINAATLVALGGASRRRSCWPFVREVSGGELTDRRTHDNLSSPHRLLAGNSK